MISILDFKANVWETVHLFYKQFYKFVITSLQKHSFSYCTYKALPTLYHVMEQAVHNTAVNVSGNVKDTSVIQPVNGYVKGPTVEYGLKTSRCFTELHDKKDIVILSPDAPLYMEKLDKSKVYVIGG